MSFNFLRILDEAATMSAEDFFLKNSPQSEIDKMPALRVYQEKKFPNKREEILKAEKAKADNLKNLIPKRLK
jgi:hypothetical protein